jgi:hypothetical protein
MPDYPELPCSQIVYRAILYKDWVTANGKIRWQAFKLFPKDTDGVSTSLTPEACTDGLEKPIFGKLSIHVGRVRDCSTEQAALDVIQDGETHASIIGLPYPYSATNEEEQQQLNDMMIFLARRIAEKAARVLHDK